MEASVLNCVVDLVRVLCRALVLAMNLARFN